MLDSDKDCRQAKIDFYDLVIWDLINFYDGFLPPPPVKGRDLEVITLCLVKG